MILFLALPFAGVACYFLFLNFLTTSPKSLEPDYYAVYEIENQLYYGGPCRSLSLKTVQYGLVECRDGPLPVLYNRNNGAVLDVHKPWDLRERWLASAGRVFVDYANGYVFWAKDGKVTNFVKLNPKLKAELLESPPQSANHPGVTPIASPNPSGDDQVPHAGGEATRETPVGDTPMTTQG